MNNKQSVTEAYKQLAWRYDRTVRLLDFFAWLGFKISGWRRQAVDALDVKAGDTVVDIGCGTGLNFPLLQRVIGPKGRIIGVDLSEAMLAQAERTAKENGWANVELECADAARFVIRRSVNAVLSAYTLTLVPGCARVVSNAAEALCPGGRFVVVDMAWPRYCPLWWRYVLFFLRSYGVTLEVLERRPWRSVQQAMRDQFDDFNMKSFWFGFFYVASGTAQGTGVLGSSHPDREGT